MKRSIAVVSAMLLVLGLAAAGAATAQESPEGTTTTGEDLVFTLGTIEDMKAVSPFKVCCAPEYEMMNIVYDQLLNYDPATLEAAPGLAETWEKNEDATEWTFHLTPGMKWSDGQPVSSQDVKFTYEYILNNPPNPFASYLPGDPTFETPDENTLIYRTKEPSLAPVSPAYVPILPEHIWSKYEGDVKAAKEARLIPTVGTGPFVLTDWKEGQFWTFEKNPYWRGKEPVMDKLIFRVYDIAEAQVQALKTGEIDYAEDLPPALFDQLVSEGDPTIETWAASPAYFINLAFGLWKPNQLGTNGEKPTNHPALMDTRVRVAIAKAIDKQALVDRVKLGYGAVGTSVLLPRDRWFTDPSEESTTQDFDPEEANRILDEAGYLDADDDGIREMPGGGNPLVLQFLTLTDSTVSTDSGEYIKSWLEDIGIEVELQPVTSGKAYDAWYAHDYDAYIWGWGNDPDPDFALWIFTTQACDVWSDGCYSNPEYDDLYDQQGAATDEAERAEIVNEMQAFLYEDVPEVILLYENTLQAWRKDRWTGMVPQPSPDGLVMFSWSKASYLQLQQVAGENGGTAAGAAPDDDGSGTTTWLIIGAVVLLVGVIAVVAMRRRKPEEDRE